jgi:hypothetical protein
MGSHEDIVAFETHLSNSLDSALHIRADEDRLRGIEGKGRNANPG